MPPAFQTRALALLTAGCLATLLGTTSCAKVGEPIPPVLLIPKPATDLSVREEGNRIVLTVSVPTQNTNDTPVTTLQQVQLFRSTVPGGQWSAPFPEKDYLEGAESILSISADKFGNYTQDKSFVLQDEMGSGQPPLQYGSTVSYAVRFVNRKKQSAGLSNFVVITPIAIPGPPSDLSAELSQYQVLLRWTPPAANLDGSTPARIVSYNVYRSEDPSKFPSSPLNSGPLQNPEFEDRGFQFDKTYYYAVSTVGNRSDPYAESFPSAPVKVVAKDTFPPGSPQNLNAVVENGVVILLWVAPPELDVAGYRVYRSGADGRGGQLLSPGLVNALSFRDEKARAGNKYQYYVTAVDTHGNEGPASHITLEVP